MFQTGLFSNLVSKRSLTALGALALSLVLLIPAVGNAAPRDRDDDDDAASPRARSADGLRRARDPCTLAAVGLSRPHMPYRRPIMALPISPLIVPSAILLVDLPVLLLTTSLVLVFLYVSRRGIRFPEAMILLVIYVAYAATRLVGPGS